MYRDENEQTTTIFNSMDVLTSTKLSEKTQTHKN